jgi:hypothetical protein
MRKAIDRRKAIELCGSGASTLDSSIPVNSTPWSPAASLSTSTFCKSSVVEEKTSGLFGLKMDSDGWQTQA